MFEKHFCSFLKVKCYVRKPTAPRSHWFPTRPLNPRGLVVWDSHELPHVRVRGGSIYRHMGAEGNVRLGSDIIQNQSVSSWCTATGETAQVSDRKKRQVVPNSYSTKQQEVQV